jgi:hypothetical protein
LEEINSSQSDVQLRANNAEDSRKCMCGRSHDLGAENGSGNDGNPGASESSTGGDSGRSIQINQRTLSLGKSDNAEQIWEWAKERLRADRSNCSLVCAGSKYLPQEGKLSAPVQLLEIHWKGREGSQKVSVESLGKPKIKEKTGETVGKLEEGNQIDQGNSPEDTGSIIRGQRKCH